MPSVNEDLLDRSQHVAFRMLIKLNTHKQEIPGELPDFGFWYDHLQDLMIHKKYEQVLQILRETPVSGDAAALLKDQLVDIQDFSINWGDDDQTLLKMAPLEAVDLLILLEGAPEYSAAVLQFVKSLWAQGSQVLKFLNLWHSQLPAAALAHVKPFLLPELLQNLPKLKEAEIRDLEALAVRINLLAPGDSSFQEHRLKARRDQLLIQAYRKFSQQSTDFQVLNASNPLRFSFINSQPPGISSAVCFLENQIRDLVEEGGRQATILCRQLIYLFIRQRITNIRECAQFFDVRDGVFAAVGMFVSDITYLSQLLAQEVRLKLNFGDLILLMWRQAFQIFNQICQRLVRYFLEFRFKTPGLILEDLIVLMNTWRRVLPSQWLTTKFRGLIQKIVEAMKQAKLDREIEAILTSESLAL